MYAGVRLAAATPLVILVFVEILCGNSGLGYLLEMSAPASTPRPCI